MNTFSEVYEQAKAKALTSLQQSWDWFQRQKTYVKVLIALLVVLRVAVGIFTLFHLNDILKFTVKVAHMLRDWRYGWLVLEVSMILVAFPPIMGLSVLCTVTGMAYGVSWTGWVLIVSSVCIGSTGTFVFFKYLLEDRARGFLKTSRFFRAVCMTMTHKDDKLLLLTLFNLCPRPYSITNAGLASIPTLDAGTFLLATVLASPKYFISLYVGSKMAQLGSDKGFKDKAVDFMSIVFAVSVSVVTVYVVYRKTKQRLDSDDYSDLELQESQRLENADGF